SPREIIEGALATLTKATWDKTDKEYGPYQPTLLFQDSAEGSGSSGSSEIAKSREEDPANPSLETPVRPGPQQPEPYFSETEEESEVGSESPEKYVSGTYQLGKSLDPIPELSESEVSFRSRRAGSRAGSRVANSASAADKRQSVQSIAEVVEPVEEASASAANPPSTLTHVSHSSAAPPATPPTTPPRSRSNSISQDTEPQTPGPQSTEDLISRLSWPPVEEDRVNLDHIVSSAKKSGTSKAIGTIT